MSDKKAPEEIGVEDLDMAVGGKAEASSSAIKDEQRVKLTADGEQHAKLSVNKGEESEKLTVSKGEEKRKHL